MAEVMPLFPLGTVVFPGLVLPVHVFEPRYRTLVADLEARPEDRREFGVVAIREGWEVGENGARALFDIGTTVQVRSIRPTEDGRFDLTTMGARRFRLLSVDHVSQPYPLAEVEWLPETQTGPQAQALAPAVAEAFVEYVCELARTRECTEGKRVDATTNRGHPPSGDPEGQPCDEAYESSLREVTMPEDARILSYLVAASVPLDLADRQRLLELSEVRERLREELRLIGRERALLAALGSVPAPLQAYAAKPSPN